MPADQLLPTLLLVAWLAPLASFVVASIAGSVLASTIGSVPSRSALAIGYVATGSVVVSLTASLAAVGVLLSGEAGSDLVFSGVWFSFLDVGSLRLSAGYYIDTLTVVMTTVVTLVATCVHVYALGYLNEEVATEGATAVVDHECLTKSGQPLRRAGRLHRFYQHLSLFTFAMLGVVVAGNVAMTFVFWELVGASSYLLIGYYYERPTAGAAATKAMLFNRVGDVGMLVGVMALWSFAGTLDYDRLFASAHDWLAQDGDAYGVLMLAGLGLFAGCVGKSAQAPLWAWLPDAMAGPTPVSALVHSATMVAAGVFLVGRITPLLPAEALLVVAVVGAITLLVGGVLATASMDLKRVLAFSTVSQLGYMMLALGLGGWTAGLFHLVTHAAFKALLFLTAGAVIHAVHTNDLGRMGGLRRRMPVSATLMAIGLLALVGAGLPGVGWGLSGFYSKDAIFEQAIAFARANPVYGWLFWAPAVGAALTGFYAARLWWLTFGGAPRSDSATAAHEAPGAMLTPMLLLGVLAIAAGWSLPGVGSVVEAIETAVPEARHHDQIGLLAESLTLPAEHSAHTVEIRRVAGRSALGATLVGIGTAAALGIAGVLLKTPGGAAMRAFDLQWLAAASRGCEATTRQLGAFVAKAIDTRMIDSGLVRATDGLGSAGAALRRVQTGSLRQYVVFLAVGVVLVGVVALGVASQWGAAG